jgi:hypothetical protein
MVHHVPSCVRRQAEGPGARCQLAGFALRGGPCHPGQTDRALRILLASRFAAGHVALGRQTDRQTDRVLPAPGRTSGRARPRGPSRCRQQKATRRRVESGSSRRTWLPQQPARALQASGLSTRHIAAASATSEGAPGKWSVSCRRVCQFNRILP